jgi:hypothetical protein
MGMVSEALGLAPIGSSMVPAVFSERAPLMRRAGRLMEMVWASARGEAVLPRDIVTRKALENACAVVCATGGSTNAALHLPAIAHEAGIRFHLDDVAEIFARTPLIADLKPGGRFLARDVYYIGAPSSCAPCWSRACCMAMHSPSRPHAGRGGGRCRRARRRSGAHGRQPDLGRRWAHGAQGQSVP